MIADKFNSRTLAAMNAALDRACARVPDGEDHAVRKRAAKEIVRCASSGETALDALIAAGERGLAGRATATALLPRRSRRLALH
ncbi:hypothetical protein [Bradyrhizobium sp. STM 3557]|uniref:hypothetical protein n=1 Tax=Bradyrhizobium sp. STM 3557 TaxID=578920 RepID=UPI003890C967